MKKVFRYIKRIFSEPEVERYTHCIYCGEEVTGSKRKFCSVACNNYYWRRVYSKKIKDGDKAHTKIETKITKAKRDEFEKKSKARHISYDKYKSLKGIKCEFCDNWAEHRHHEDYDKPKKVNFLCWACHGKVHANNIELKGGK